MTDPVTAAVESTVETGATSFLGSFGIYIAIGLIVAAFLSGCYVTRLYYKAQNESNLQEQITVRDTLQKKLTKLQDDNDHLSQLNDAKQKQIDAGITNEVTKTVYRCLVPASGKLLLNK